MLLKIVSWNAYKNTEIYNITSNVLGGKNLSTTLTFLPAELRIHSASNQRSLVCSSSLH